MEEDYTSYGGGAINGLERQILFVIKTPIDPVRHGNKISFKEVELTYILRKLGAEENPFMVSEKIREAQKDLTTVTYFHLPVKCSQDHQMNLRDILPKDEYERKVNSVKKRRYMI